MNTIHNQYGRMELLNIPERPKPGVVLDSMNVPDHMNRAAEKFAVRIFMPQIRKPYTGQRLDADSPLVLYFKDQGYQLVGVYVSHWNEHKSVATCQVDYYISAQQKAKEPA